VKITAVEHYDAPKIPTLGDNNTTMLKKLPKRWQKNAKVAACIGVMGTLTFSGLMGCVAEGPVPHGYGAAYSESNDGELTLRLHHGGGGFPFYVVHITEEEAFSMIRAQLEAAGFNFDAIPPAYTVDFGAPFSPAFGLSLFDKDKNIAISHITWEDNNIPFFSHGGSRLALDVAEKFRQQTDDISVGVFFTPSVSPKDEWWTVGDVNSLTAEGRAEARAQIEAELTTQVREFIDFFFSSSGMSPRINVTLNGTPIVFETSPMIVDGRTMVPMREMFELFGAAYTLDAPPVVIDGREFVPLRVVSEALEAEIEWDEDTRTVAITAPDIRGLELSVRAHGGGGGPIPFYVVHLTEQEVLNIISEMFSEVGVYFDDMPPDYKATVTQQFRNWNFENFGEYTTHETDVGIDLFDNKSGVGIAKVGGGNFASLARVAFREQVEGVNVGVFYNPEINIGHEFLETTPTAQEIAEGGAQARERFVAQIRQFIDSFLATCN